MARSETFNQFVTTVENQVKAKLGSSSEVCKILVVGEGINGKASVRTVLTAELSEKLPGKVVISFDKDYSKGPLLVKELNLTDGTSIKPSVYVVEDIHGLDDNLKHLDEEKYDLMVCVIPNIHTYRHNLVERGLAWIAGGVIDLTNPEAIDPQRLQQASMKTGQKLEQMSQDAPYWLQQQSRNLHEIRRRQIPLIVVEPTSILNELYPGRKASQHLADKNFSQAIEEYFSSEPIEEES